MTSYYLSLGYQANQPYIKIPESKEEYDSHMWKRFKKCFFEVSTNTEKLKADILDIGFQKLTCHGELENKKNVR
jgi:hypothetical protein